MAHWMQHFSPGMEMDLPLLGTSWHWQHGTCNNMALLKECQPQHPAGQGLSTGGWADNEEKPMATAVQQGEEWTNLFKENRLSCRPVIPLGKRRKDMKEITLLK